MLPRPAPFQYRDWHRLPELLYLRLSYTLLLNKINLTLRRPDHPSRRRYRHYDIEKMGAHTPNSCLAGFDTGDRQEERETGSGNNRTDNQGAGRGRRRVPRADRAAPSRTTGALLPHARITPGRRRRPTGYAASRLARPRRVRRTLLDPHLALPDRYQPLPQCASLGRPTPGQGMGHPGG